MTAEVRYRPVRPGEEERVAEMVAATFREFVGHEYPPQGVEEFLRFAAPEALAARIAAGEFVLLAVAGQEPVGVIELRGGEHLSALFVARRFHRRGVARELFRRALEAARRARPDLERMTVHSSRYAVPVYEKLGFEVTAPETTVNGMTFVPMALALAARPDSAGRDEE